MRAAFHWKALCARAMMVATALLACLCAAARADSDGVVRVKLARLGTPSTIAFRADCDYTLAADATVRVPADTDARLSASGGRLTLTCGGQSRDLGESALLLRDASGSRGVSFSDPALSGRFCGDLALTAAGDTVAVVLRIYVEDYLYGVVGCELSPSSGREALKAMAIVARNYALRQKSVRTSAAYDLSDTGDALSFRGYNASKEYADVIRAVDETRGQVACYQGSPATCYFCESNGGQTESAANALGKPLPYSVVKDDPYDFESTGAKRTATLRKDASGLRPELADALIAGMAAQLERLELSTDPADVQITAIEAVTEGDARFDAPSRLYGSLALKLGIQGRTALGEARDGTVTVSIPTYGGLERWYGLELNAADNETVWVAEGYRAFEITFRRKGTGLGMSQRGAQVMAREGLSCEDILQFYYPGIELRTLSLSDAAREDAAPTAAPAFAPADPIATARLGRKTPLYEKADAKSDALATLPAGATAQVYGVQGDWAAIGSGGLYGFAPSDALADFQLAGVAVTAVKDEVLARISAAAEVLQLPVETAKSLGRLSEGDSARLLAYGDQWAMIATADGTEGFIPRAALTLDGASAAEGGVVAAPEDLYGLLTEDAGLYVNTDDSILPKATLTQGSYVRITAYNNAWAYVRAEDGAEGFVKLSGLSAARQAPQSSEESVEGGAVTVVKGKAYRYVADDALTLYERYSTDSAALATLSRGEKVRLGAYNAVWACVRANGVTGFVLLSGLTDVPPEGEASDTEIEGGAITRLKGEHYAVVTRDDAPLYPSWSTSDAPLARLDEGTRVRLGAYNAAWACVRVNGVTGFMRVDALEAVK